MPHLLSPGRSGTSSSLSGCIQKWASVCLSFRLMSVGLGSTSPGLLFLLLPKEGKNVVPAPLKGVTFLHNLGETTYPHPGGERGLDF